MTCAADNIARAAVEGDRLALAQKRIATYADGWISLAGYEDPPSPPPGLSVEVRRDSHLGIAEAYRFVPARIGDWMQTFTGRAVYPLDLRPADVDIRDIAHALSMQCRYAGHTLRFYSVAEHSVQVARWCRKFGTDAALHGLLHDATEAYLVDVPRPVKPFLTGYREAEARAWDVVCQRFGLAMRTPLVAEADNRILNDERAALMTPCEREWLMADARPLGITIEGWLPARAEREFLALFDELYGED